MISTQTKSYLRGRTATAKTWQELQREQEDKIKALKMRRALEEFRDRLHAYAVTEEGQARAQYLRDREYDAAIAEYQKQRE